jgi:hypothetical protein
MELRCAQNEPVEQCERGHHLHALGDEPILLPTKAKFNGFWIHVNRLRTSGAVCLKEQGKNEVVKEI